MRTTTFETNGVSSWIGAVRSRCERTVRDRASAAARGARARAARRALPLGLFVVVLSFVLAPASAQALLVHSFSFGTAGSGAGQVESPQGVAIDQSTGDVYVVDAGNFRVDKFTPSLSAKAGDFDLAFGQDVGGSGVDVCTTTCTQGTQGTSAGAFQTPQFVAVDNSSSGGGDVYVGDPGDGTISKFNPSGDLITSWGSGGQLNGSATFGTIDGITVDNSGNLLVINGNNVVYEFAQNGTAVTNFPTTRGNDPNGLDVNASFSTSAATGDLFKVNGDNSVEELTPPPSGSTTANDVGTIDESASATQLTIDRSTGDLYEDTGSQIDQFQFNPSGAVIDSGGPCPVVPSGSCAPSDTFGSGVLSAGTGLGYDVSEPALYVADEGNNTVAVFVTPSPSQPVIDGETASGVGSTYATLNAEVNPFGFATTCEFEYVDNANYNASAPDPYSAGTTVPCPGTGLGSSFSDQSATINIPYGSLTVNTEYHFRVVATNHAGTVDGTDQTFTTLGAASIDSQSSSNVGSTYATLSAQINPLGTSTSCKFEYVDDANYDPTATDPYSAGATVPCTAGLGSGTSDASTSVNLPYGTLAINTEYHWRVVASNTLGTADGGDQTFTTLGAASIDSQSSSNVLQNTATLSAQVNPLGTSASCTFEYVDNADYDPTATDPYSAGTTVPCTAGLGSGTSDASASVNVTNLTINTEYHWRVVASNTLGTADGGDQTFTTLPAVSIDSESVGSVTDTTATLNAEINPEGLDTTYEFEYGTSTSYGTKVPSSPVDIGSETSDQSASFNLTGLTPGTTYHWRVVATNSAAPAGGVDGADRTFTTYPSTLPTGLPDSRAYELVTPANADNLSPYLRSGPGFGFEASSGGNAFAFLSLETLPNSQSYGASYLSTRGSSGWTTADMVPPQGVVTGTLSAIDSGIVSYSSDMSGAILQDGENSSQGAPVDDPPLVPGTTSGGLPLCSATPVVTPCSGEPKGVQNVFFADGGTYQLVDNLENAPSGVTPADATYDGGSSDLGVVVFDENAALTKGAPSGDDLYEWTPGTTSANGPVSLVTEVPSGSATSCSGSSCTAVNGSLAGGGLANSLNAVSAGGIYFNANGNLYLRQGTSTFQVDAPASGAAGTGGGGQFAAASNDGSKVFFTDDASAGLTSNTASGSGTNLYEYTAKTATSPASLTDLTSNGMANVDGVSGVSEDGSYVYFVANGVLATNANSQGQTAVLNQPNLYVWHEGPPATTTFVATLSGNDSGDWSSSPTARVSSHGAYLAFESVQSLTGFDNTDAASGGADDEIFLYDAAANKVSCVSCSPSGAAPTASTTISGPEGAGISGSQQFLQRYVSDNGQVFFDTSDSLLPADTNGLTNVYEYEGGQLRLLSSGTSDANAYYLDSTPDGSNVFLATTEQLLPQDTSNGYAIYDARANGGFAFSPPAPPCQGDSCKPPATSPPAVPTAASVTFSGPGNATSSTEGKARVVSRTVTGTTIKVQVKVPAAGVITVTGTGMKQVTRGVNAAGTYTITLHLTKAEKKRLARKRKLKLPITVKYASVTGSTSSVNDKLTVKA